MMNVRDEMGCMEQEGQEDTKVTELLVPWK